MTSVRPPGLFSVEGYRRLQLCRDELRALRQRLDQSLPDLVSDIAQTIGLDVEVAVRSGASARPGWRERTLTRSGMSPRGLPGVGRWHLVGVPRLSRCGEEEERGLTPGEVEVVDGAVQILTVHAAKGLEWDVVAVGGLCADAFPAKPKASDHWLKGMGVLPFPLRGDAIGLSSVRAGGGDRRPRCADRR
jgi:DNA helicase-2/ATP-dependent DNA helicase PcrA